MPTTDGTLEAGGPADSRAPRLFLPVGRATAFACGIGVAAWCVFDVWLSLA